MNGEIYIIKNDINNKVYVGQTTQGSEERFKQHLKLLKSNEKQLIHKAIKKYGKEHFYFDVLESNIDLSVLDDREEYWIQYYDSVSNGYNLCAGGHQTRKPINLILVQFKDEIINRYLVGDISLRNLALEYGVGNGSLSRFLKKNGIDIKHRNKNSINLTIEDKEKIADMYEHGLSTNEIAKIMNRDIRTVRRYKQYECCA